MRNPDFHYNPGINVGITGILGVAFVVLKLTRVIDWSWWLVTLPFWGSAILGLIILLVCCVIIHFKE